MERWEGKVAVVSGASAGIGASIVEELVKHGMIVVGLARRKERVEELANKLSGEKGKVYAVKADVSNEEEVKSAFKWVRETLGKLHVLVNNAGITRNVPLSQMEKPDVIRQIFETNVIGLSLCTGEAVCLMKETGVDDGHIIHINSVAGHSILPYSGHHAYGASKHAVTVLTEGLRRELMEAKSSIRVTSVSPGLVKTEIFEAAGGDPNIYQNPHLQPKDIADCVIFALQCPPNVQIHELTVKPIGEGC
ncbi:hypothetical protein J437_LFUL017052 [Ladona fulva]|uniref:Farnesol dehydrogenase n=1 Tax=Ladona fulva TaxID=123851 RepID=A0A8K0KJW5_LADFU|nr:hypothetical protein J437_LFUL017052 [Ladona fulva]